MKKEVIDFNRKPKQEYIAPVIDVVNIDSPQLLAGSAFSRSGDSISSGTGSGGGDYGDDDTIY